MRLKSGYSLVWGDRSGHEGCGAGTSVTVDLIKDGKTVKKFVTCPCGRGCGNKDVVVDTCGDHDCESEIEAVRLD